jgi:hypothetical protein
VSIVNDSVLHLVIKPADDTFHQRAGKQRRHEEGTMTNEERLAYVGRRAYELAAAGEHEDFAEIQRAMVKEGHAELVPWLEKPGVIDAINEICAISREVAATT